MKDDNKTSSKSLEVLSIVASWLIFLFIPFLCIGIAVTIVTDVMGNNENISGMIAVNIMSACILTLSIAIVVAVNAIENRTNKDNANTEDAASRLTSTADQNQKV